MAMDSSSIDQWRKYFRTAPDNIFEVIENAITVAVLDYTEDFRIRRDQIAEKLYLCQLTWCAGCDGVEITVPKEENVGDFKLRIGFDGNGGNTDAIEGKGSKVNSSINDNGDMNLNHTSNYSYPDAELLTEEIEEESEIEEEVLRIKELLSKSDNQAEDVILELLRKLQLMSLSVQSLQATKIGMTVNHFRRHRSKCISNFARSLIKVWKDLVDEWINVVPDIKGGKGSPDSINPSVVEEGLPSPPLDEGAFLATQTSSMELSGFFDGMDEDGNFRNCNESNTHNENERKTKVQNHRIPMRKMQPSHAGNVSTMVKQKSKLSNTDVAPTRPPKIILKHKVSDDTKLQQELDAVGAQKTALYGQQDKSKYLDEKADQLKLEAAKRKLHKGYQQAENAKKQRTIQVMELHELPKQGLGPGNAQISRQGNHNGNISNGRGRRQTKQAHAFAILNGLIHRNPSISASLMLNYANFGLSSTSRLIFDQTNFKYNAFLWNTLIRAYSITHSHYSAFEIYNQMICNGVPPDDHTFPFVLKVCADVCAVEKGREIHGVIFKLGFCGDIFVGNTLISLYAGAHLWDAQKLFDEMLERDVVSWNSIIVAYSDNGCYSVALDWFLKLISSSGLRPNSVSVITVLPVCGELGEEETTSGIHVYVVKAGLASHLTVCNALVDAYSKCGKLDASKLAFDEMVEKNVVSWNVIIAGFAHKGHARCALNMFRSMLTEREKPDSVTLTSLLPSLVELELFDMGKEIHAYSIRRDMASDVFVANSLIDMYAKSGCVGEASTVFYKMDCRTVVSWNAMIANFAQNRLEVEAIRLIAELQVHGLKVNSVTFTNVLPACARIGCIRQGKEIHAMSIRIGFAFDLFVSNALTDMYAKCGSLTFARNVFDISVRDEVSYNILVDGYSQSERCSESVKLFSEMRKIGLKHDPVSFMGVLSACANLSAIKQGKEIHGLLVRRLLYSHLFIANSLLDLYTKCGHLGFARRVFEQTFEKDVASWNTMILGYGMQGEWDVAIDLFDAMRDDNVKYDSVSYVAILSVCSHGGLVDKGVKYFEEMLARDLKPTCTHYACMVDLLGRAGFLEKAAEFVRGLTIEPDANVWGALLGACRLHGNIKLGRWAAEHLFELKPEHSGYYILLSNMYADAGEWDEANKIRTLMKSRGTKKNPACSWLEMHDNIQAFVVGESLENKAMELSSASSG
ncbi:Pentatricopeptide repeat-containing protein [Thalictrum thalictroides]|uniref:Pentatricopeptide repeat-containing protein n=1 Tax=Thalictrum thalictroides TaxID=46969 RepID=A0A7J6WG29_THATH|nr:Pentatricopeptide repeat-containing protein [Thalictrum thalictroides]